MLLLVDKEVSVTTLSLVSISYIKIASVPASKFALLNVVPLCVPPVKAVSVSVQLLQCVTSI